MEGSGAIPLKCMFYPANGFLGFMPPRLWTKPHSRFRLFRHHCLRTGACPRKSRDDRRRLLWTCFRYGRIRICSSRQPGGPDGHHFRLSCLLISAVDRITHGVPAEPRCGSSSGSFRLPQILSLSAGNRSSHVIVVQAIAARPGYLSFQEAGMIR
jgi:hypothetical protein